MQNVAKLERPSATVSSQTVSPALAAALETPVKILEDGTAQPSTWKPPAVVTSEVRHEAAARAAEAVRWMQPVEDATVRQWLSDLGVLVAGSLSVEEARAKLSAYTSLIEGEYPRACFTKKTLADAARRFPRFFPSFGEVAAYLDEVKGELRVRLDRLHRIAKPVPMPQREVEPEQPWNGPRQLGADVLEALARCKADLAAAKPFTVDAPRRR